MVYVNDNWACVGKFIYLEDALSSFNIRTTLNPISYEKRDICIPKVCDSGTNLIFNSDSTSSFSKISGKKISGITPI